MAATPDNFTTVEMNISSNGTTNSTDAAWSPVAFIADHKDLLLIQSQMVLSAIGIIYLGAHGALRRPPSAALPDKKKRKKNSNSREEPFAEGLQASDAILFPIMAGSMLIGLYYLIKWLQDPAILNKILRWYMSLASIASMGLWFTDTLHLLTGLVFPTIWTDMKGRVYRVDQAKKCQWLVDPADSSRHLSATPAITSPLAGILSRGFVPTSAASALWTVRRTLKEEWTVKITLHGLLKERFGITLNGIIGFVLAFCLAGLYHWTDSPTISNIMGLAMSYGAFVIMSCTSFTIGSLVLIGLFFYDIVMVFYTPYMVTVATKIDAPIKLVYKSQKGSSLLGLGDIVIPGIFICLALRFDLWKHYQKQVKYVPTELETEVEGEATDKSVTTTEVRRRAVKAPYVNAQGRWGDRFWNWSPSAPLRTPAVTKGLEAAAFGKTYFHASVAGYLLGMLVTLSMLLVFKRGQPALLYLVPGVVGATWLTGLARGELREMWTYTEDGSIDTQDVVVEVDADGNVVREVARKEGKKEKGEEGKADKSAAAKKNGVKEDGEKTEEVEAKQVVGVDEKTKSKEKVGAGPHDVFLFAITAPGDAEVEEEE